MFFTKMICVLNESVFIYIKGIKECCKDSVVLHFTFIDRVYHLVCKCIKRTDIRLNKQAAVVKVHYAELPILSFLETQI